MSAQKDQKSDDDEQYKYWLQVPKKMGPPGNQRFEWLRAGTAIEREDGVFDAFLNMMPTGQWDGRIRLIPRQSED